MANKFYTPEQAAKVAVELVAEGARLSALISRDLTDDLLGGGKGRTVNLKVPTALVAHARNVDDVTNKIILDTISELTVPVTLGTHVYNAVGLSEGELNLDLTNFSAQVLAPQTEAVSAWIEDMTRAALAAEPMNAALSAAGEYDPAEPQKFFTKLRKALRDRGVPATGLNVVVGSGIYGDLMDAKAIEDASQSGSTEALREGNVGKIRGFLITEDADFGEYEVVAFHRNAYTLATRAPRKPEGAAFGATVSDKGISMRYLRDYHSDVTQDVSLVSTFAGIAKMPLYKVVRTSELKEQGEASFTNGSASVVEVEGGAVIRATATPKA